jgi:transcriptional antiterminator RfaH
MASETPEKRWYLVYAKPRKEDLAKVNLERQGYPVYLPMMRTPRRKLGRRIIRVEPMFPRYLFIHLDTETDNWAPIRSTLGVANLVRFGMFPTPVPDDLIQILRARDNASGVQELPLNTFEEGQRVRIEEGPFIGYEGIFLAHTSEERVLILLDIVGKAARAQVNIEHLGPATD